MKTQLDRRALVIVAIVSLILVALPWSVQTMSEDARAFSYWISSYPERRFRANVNRQRQAAPHVLEALPGDRARFPRHGFTVLYDMGYGLKFDSAAGTLSYDERWEPDTTIRFALGAAAMDSLYEMALAARLFDLRPAPLKDATVHEEEYWGAGPLLVVGAGQSRDSIRILEYGPSSLSPHWPSDYDHPEAFYYSDDYKRLARIQLVLDHMLIEQLAGRRDPLPKRKGGLPL